MAWQAYGEEPPERVCHHGAVAGPVARQHTHWTSSALSWTKGGRLRGRPTHPVSIGLSRTHPPTAGARDEASTLGQTQKSDGWPAWRQVRARRGRSLVGDRPPIPFFQRGWIGWRVHGRQCEEARRAVVRPPDFEPQSTPPDPRKQAASSVARLPSSPTNRASSPPLGGPCHRTWQPLPPVSLAVRGGGGPFGESSSPPV